MTPTASLVSDISTIGEAAWTAHAQPAGTPYHPFVDYRFLAALEESGSVGKASGWMPAHIVVKAGDEIVGLAPNYVKQHSQGEYIFDHHWARAFEGAGGRYYPKMLSAAPFTPANGPRLLVSDTGERAGIAAAIASACHQLEMSSAHVNFVTPADRAACAAQGFLHREGTQYHWFNRQYADYDGFLETLTSRKRKAIKKERRAAADSGLTFRMVRGHEANERDWDAFWIFYQDTGARKWGHPYLTRTFFRLVAQTMGEKILLIFADRDGAPIAGALNFIGEDTLYGRYWGCTEYHPFLHFEVCYHQAIDYAIAHGLACVEAGAQGEHKIARGYEPVATHSMHYIDNESFRDAIARYLAAERQQNEAEIEILSDYTPYRKG